MKKTNAPGEPIKHGRTLTMRTELLDGVKTKSLYIRTGTMHGTRFLSSRGFGGFGGDICCIEEDTTLEVSQSMFGRLSAFWSKAVNTKKD